MKYHTKVKLLICLSVLLLIVILAALVLGIMQGEDIEPTEPSDTSVQSPVMTVEPTASIAPTVAPTLEPTQPETEVETAATTQEPTSEPTAEPTQAPSKKPSSGNNSTKPTKPTTSKETEPPALSFPYSIPGTSLVVDQVNSYDGIFLEDGSDKEVTGITVIVLKNTGSIGVEYANVTMEQNGRKLEFKATAIPGGATVVVQEASAASYRSDKITECSADVALLEKFEMSTGFVKIEENSDGTLSVTNLGDQTIPCVRVFYKFAMEKGKIFVGGIAYNAKVTELKAGESQQIAPSHYAAGSSEVLMVRTYATAD